MKKFFKKIIAAIAAFFGKLAPELRSAVHTAVSITENFKKVLDSPVADLITALIPGTTDDKVKAFLRQRLPSILMSMRLVESIVVLDPTDDILAAATRYVSQLEKSERNRIMHDLATRLTEVLADGKITFSEAVQLTEYYYNEEFKPAQLSSAA